MSRISSSGPLGSPCSGPISSFSGISALPSWRWWLRDVNYDHGPDLQGKEVINVPGTLTPCCPIPNFEIISIPTYHHNPSMINNPWVLPPPSNSDHKDYYMFSRGFLLTFTFHCYWEGAISKIIHHLLNIQTPIIYDCIMTKKHISPVDLNGFGGHCPESSLYGNGVVTKSPKMTLFFKWNFLGKVSSSLVELLCTLKLEVETYI